MINPIVYSRVVPLPGGGSARLRYRQSWFDRSPQERLEGLTRIASHYTYRMRWRDRLWVWALALWQVFLAISGVKDRKDGAGWPRSTGRGSRTRKRTRTR